MEISRVDFNRIEKVWDELYKGNVRLSPFMSYEFQKNYRARLWFSKVRFGMIYYCFQFSEENHPICIVPLITKNNKDFYIAGDFCATGYLDFVYTDRFERAKFSEVIQILQKKLGGCLHLNKINQSSILGEYLLQNYDNHSNICVNISLGDSFESYYKRLKKSVRQNIRTAHNRLVREEKSIRLDVAIGSVDAKMFKQVMQIYHKRAEEKNGKTVSAFVRFVQNYFNPITVAQLNQNNSFISTLYIDDAIAGFMTGFVTNEDIAIVVPRLAINTEFNVYCPGFLLVSETIQWLLDNSQIKNLDLSRGDETYKYSLGGETHFNFDFEL